jgi:hypothetical protein
MKTNMKNWIWVIGVLSAAIIFAACDNTNEVGKGQVDFEITDAPSDDAQVKGVYVTIADVKVNGESIAGFSGKQTINLKAYHEGLSKLLGSAELDARTYNSLSLVIDLDQDKYGNAPGCYALTTDNTKYKLATSGSGKLEVKLTKPWTVRANEKIRLVMDVDLRKALRYAQDPAVRYAFIENIQTAVRVVTAERSGTITGTFDGNFNSTNEEVVVYAYKKGTFNADVETSENENGIQFRNAINSGIVKVGVISNSYKLAFMEEGEYELYFALYSKNETTGKLSLDAILNTELEINGKVGNAIRVVAGANLTVSASPI